MLDHRSLDRLEIAAGQKPKEREYWRDQLSGSPAKVSFPYEHKKKEKHERYLVMEDLHIRDHLGDQLVKLSNQSDARLHMILTAGVFALLHKFTGSSDIIVGMPIYKEDVEGTFINTVLALRLEVLKTMTFKELLLQVRETVTKAVQHQDYPIEVLLKDLNMQIFEDDFPLFDVVVLLENIHDKNYLQHIHPGIIFSFSRLGNMLEGTVAYKPLCYGSAAVERIFSHLSRLFEQVLRDVNTPLSAVEVLSKRERDQLLFQFNHLSPLSPVLQSPGRSLPSLPLHCLFEQQVEETPDRTALVKNNISITYGLLNRKVNQLTYLLREKGVKPGTITAVILEPSIEMIAGILAILKAGGAYLPIDHEYPEERVLSILKDNQVSIVLTTSHMQNKYSFTDLRGFEIFEIEPEVNPLRAQSDFDSLPHPDRSLINFEKYSQYIGHAMVKNAVSIQGSRGCPYNCAFCHRTMMKKNVARSAENIFEEVKYYYDRGVRRFSFVDEIFNLNTENSKRFFHMVIKNQLEIQLFFPNGMRADRLTEDYIDLMVEAGTVNLGLALETASPRLQKLIRKNLDIEKLRRNAEYFCSQYPHVILELFTMHGFPTETEEEAMTTLEFIKSLKWVHFPYVFLLKIHPSTDMMQLALENGVPLEAIRRSMTAAFHEIPETLPFPKHFTRQYVAQFLNQYFLNRERLLHVLPFQLKVASEDELSSKYDNYLPAKIQHFSDFLASVGISREELGKPEDLGQHRKYSDIIPDYEAIRQKRYASKQEDADAFRVLLLDLSVLFTSEARSILHGEVTEPLGLVYLMTYLNETFGSRITGKIAKSKIDFDSFDQLKELVCSFKPQLIGIRTLSYFKDFFHQTVSLIKAWGIDAPIIAGGPYGTSDYRLVLQDPHVELTVLREGELTLAHLVEKMMENGNKFPAESTLKEIQGIAYMKQEDKTRLWKRNRDVICLDREFQTVERIKEENPVNKNKCEDLLYLISTSGSTGNPKSVMLEHRNLLNLMDFQFSRTNIDFSRVLQFASIGFDVSAQEIFSTLLSGGTLYLMDRETKYDIPRLFEYIRKNAVEILFLPPAFLKFIFTEPAYARLFSGTGSVKHIIAAGEQLVVPEKFRTYLKNNGVFLHNHYGPSETHVVSSLTLAPDAGIPELPSIGKPVFNTRLYILDEDKKLLPIGVPGELYIAGENVGRGYYRREALTREKYMEDPFFPGQHQRMYRTGDLARWLPPPADGDSNLEFLGRIDHQVKIRGYRIELGEIESQLLKRPDISEAVVVTRGEQLENKYLCAYVVGAGGPGEKPDSSDLRDYLSYALPDYMVPSYFIPLTKIPLTPNGKVDKKVLPEPGVTAAANYAAPANEVEEQLANIWSEVLGVGKEAISTNANFFELGGHSLKATIMAAKILQAFDVKVPLVEIFRIPFIAKLAEYIEQNRTGALTGSVEADHRLVLLREKPGSSRHLFLIHDGSGEVDGYIEFCNGLNGDFNCWGVKADRITDYTPRHVTVADMAGDYIRGIKEIQPQGPYFIAGWSLGGTIAFEVALQLETMGEEIAFLGLIDASGPRDEWRQQGIQFNLESERHWIWDSLPDADIKEKLGQVSDMAHIWPMIVNYLEEKNVSVETVKKIIPEEYARVIPNYDRLSNREVIYYLNMCRTMANAGAFYIPGAKIKTVLHYFKARQSPGGMRESWRAYCHQAIKVYEFPGDHFSILKNIKADIFEDAV